MALKIWHIDAFASKPLEGNPAAVVPLERWLDDGLMQAIAAENNLSETAFFVKTGIGTYDLRWFAPALEVDLCGHATLASAWVLFNKIEQKLNEIRFMTRSGELAVTRGTDGNIMSLPSAASEVFSPPPGFLEELGKSFGAPPPRELHMSAKGGAGAKTLIAVWQTPDQIKTLTLGSEMQSLAIQVGASSVIATAAGGGQPYDMVSRFFAPYYGVPEDPVTGSAHCALTPFWSKRLGKKTLRARQASARGGDLECTDDGARTILRGTCALYLTGEIEI